jgi:hypothetical protein
MLLLVFYLRLPDCESWLLFLSPNSHLQVRTLPLGGMRLSETALAPNSHFFSNILFFLHRHMRAKWAKKRMRRLKRKVCLVFVILYHRSASTLQVRGHGGSFPLSTPKHGLAS